MPIRPYILFDGNAREAIEFYAYVFDTKADSVITFGEIPQNPDFPIADEARDRVWNARMRIGGDVVQISDIGPFPGFTVGNNLDLFYINPSAAEIATIYGRLIEGGSAQVELMDAAGPDTYANVTDKFGISWQLYTRESLS